ncbi:MAG: SpoIID/LytB domain-containing protein [Oligoflexia bacterium]|nr:SpoIID/LytB domain-containing protein [Oligoflexia bacterium]
MKLTAFIVLIGMLQSALAFGAVDQELLIVDEPPRIRMRIKSVEFPVKVQAEGLTLATPSKRVLRPVAYNGVRELVLMKQMSSLVAKDLKGSSHRLADSEVMLESESGEIQINNQKLPSPILLKRTQDRLEAIVLISLEKYVMGVLEGEMPTSWPIEALKAQAVAARSYVLAQMQSRLMSGYDVESTTVDQVYRHPELHPNLEKLKTAVESTKGMVLSKSGKVLKAYYHSACGGHTERSSDVWGGSDSVDLQSVADPFCKGNPSDHWELKVSKLEFQSLYPELNGTSPSDLALRVVTRTGSGRVALLAVTSRSTANMITGNDLRSKLGYGKLRSTFFTVQNSGEFIVFRGHGFGHGSGLCQWGARKQALSGKDFRKILKYYYPQAVLVNSDVRNL